MYKILIFIIEVLKIEKFFGFFREKVFLGIIIICVYNVFFIRGFEWILENWFDDW